MYRKFGMKCGIYQFPAYNKLTRQKEQCYPNLVTISQTLATVNPKDAILKTLERINLVLNFVEIVQTRKEVSEIIFEMKVRSIALHQTQCIIVHLKSINRINTFSHQFSRLYRYQFMKNVFGIALSLDHHFYAEPSLQLSQKKQMI